MLFLIDTDIIIYSLKNNDTVKNNFLKNADAVKIISVISYGELLYGALKSENTVKNIAVVRRISELFPVIEVSKPIIETFAEIKSSLHKKGSPIDDMDLLIAATALHLNCTLVTNNERHFTGIPGIAFQNWAK